jgi:hypothetical protein
VDRNAQPFLQLLARSVHEFAREAGREIYLIAESIKEVFSRGDMDEVNRILQQEFDGEAYAFTVLFRDEQQRTLNRIAESAWGEDEAAFGNL